ncbi:MAG: hypothetical protein KIS67_21260 [Verrucomicrobiae bacterium]|nr:hypothetical protein [Verrucomicrobiae bacterium]
MKSARYGLGIVAVLLAAAVGCCFGQRGVTVNDCVAFRLDRADAPRVELGLAGTAAPDAQTSTVQAPFRVLRCNNITAPVQLRLSSTGNP